MNYRIITKTTFTGQLGTYTYYTLYNMITGYTKNDSTFSFRLSDQIDGLTLAGENDFVTHIKTENGVTQYLTNGTSVMPNFIRVIASTKEDFEKALKSYYRSYDPSLLQEAPAIARITKDRVIAKYTFSYDGANCDAYLLDGSTDMARAFTISYYDQYGNAISHMAPNAYSIPIISMAPKSNKFRQVHAAITFAKTGGVLRQLNNHKNGFQIRSLAGQPFLNFGHGRALISKKMESTRDIFSDDITVFDKAIFDPHLIFSQTHLFLTSDMLSTPSSYRKLIKDAFVPGDYAATYTLLNQNIYRIGTLDESSSYVSKIVMDNDNILSDTESDFGQMYENLPNTNALKILLSQKAYSDSAGMYLEVLKSVVPSDKVEFIKALKARLADVQISDRFDTIVVSLCDKIDETVKIQVQTSVNNYVSQVKLAIDKLIRPYKDIDGANGRVMFDDLNQVNQNCDHITATTFDEVHKQIDDAVGGDNGMNTFIYVIRDGKPARNITKLKAGDKVVWNIPSCVGVVSDLTGNIPFIYKSYIGDFDVSLHRANKSLSVIGGEIKAGYYLRIRLPEFTNDSQPILEQPYLPGKIMLTAPLKKTLERITKSVSEKFSTLVLTQDSDNGTNTISQAGGLSESQTGYIMPKAGKYSLGPLMASIGGLFHKNTAGNASYRKTSNFYFTSVGTVELPLGSVTWDTQMQTLVDQVTESDYAASKLEKVNQILAVFEDMDADLSSYTYLCVNGLAYPQCMFTWMFNTSYLPLTQLISEMKNAMHLSAQHEARYNALLQKNPSLRAIIDDLPSPSSVPLDVDYGRGHFDGRCFEFLVNAERITENISNTERFIAGHLMMADY